MEFEFDVYCIIYIEDSFSVASKFACQSAHPNDSTDEWKKKLTMLLNDSGKQELISREKKVRRDFEQIAVLASRMGLYRYAVCFVL